MRSALASRVLIIAHRSDWLSLLADHYRPQMVCPKMVYRDWPEYVYALTTNWNNSSAFRRRLSVYRPVL